MRKNTLTEEIYRMRKLMGHDSNEYRENVTSFDRLLEEKLVKKYLIKEQEEEVPVFSDWSKGGKFNWENAKLKDIIEYIREVDEYFGGSFLNNPSYTTMMDWFEGNDSESVRNSLKEWMFGDIYYGIKKSEDVKQT
jgi:radical SAM superfamily enzyme